MRFSHLLTEKVEISFGINLERRQGRRGEDEFKDEGKEERGGAGGDGQDGL